MNDFTENDITQYRDAKRNTEMGKIALSIIQGIEKNSKIPPERAIWEMVQNAHDVSVEKGADIEFENARDYFYFRHNGIPFTYESINALNTQSSSKVQSNIRMIGQYGTGFMTTNKFGLVFEVSGSLCDGHNKYINFSDLRMDRSERDPKKLIKILDKQSEQIEGYLRELERSVECGKYTEFKYHKQYPIEKDNAYQAITRAPALVPYVLALINRINSIQFIDEGNNRSSFVRGVEETLEDGNYYIHKCITIHTANTNEDETPRSNKIFILDSKECIDNENIPKISVILPLREDSDSGKVTVFQFDHNVPNHFIFLPLIGTECWGVNYIFHSPLFQCNDELRDSVQFVSTGQYGDEECDRNKEIISIAGNMIDEFWKTHLLKYNNVKYVAKVRFGINDSNEKIATYNKELQKEWAERYKDYPIATAQDGKLTTPKSLKLLSYEFLDEVKKNQTLRDAVHYFIAKQYGSSCVPIREDLIYWSEIVADT